MATYLPPGMETAKCSCIYHRTMKLQDLESLELSMNPPYLNISVLGLKKNSHVG